MSDKTYNGWTNYETWNVALWIDNEQGDYEYWQGRARRVFEDSIEKHESYNTPSEQARYDLADELKAHFEEAQPDLGASMWADLLGAAMSEVNWHEIANSRLEECEGDDKEGNTVKYEYAKD